MVPLDDGERPDRDAAFAHADAGEALGRKVARVEGVGHHAPDGGVIPAFHGVPIVAVELVGPLPGSGAPKLAHLALQLAAPPAPLGDKLEDSGDEGRHLAVHAHAAGRVLVEDVAEGNVAPYKPARGEPVAFGMQGQRIGHLGLQPLEVRPHVADLRVESARAVHETEAHGHQHLLDVEASLREARREHRYVGYDHAVGPAVLNNAHELVEGGANVAYGIAVPDGLRLARIAVGGEPRLARRRLRRHIGDAKPAAHPVIGGKVHDAAPSAVLARPGDTARRRQHVGEIEARHHATSSCLEAHAATGSPNRKTTSMSPPSPTSTLSMSSTTITRSRPSASR